MANQPIEHYTEERVPFGSADIPPIIPRGIMYVFMDGDKPVAVDFQCPCGCGTTCYTPVVLPGEKQGPRQWIYTPGPTLSPSIRYMGGCKAHFNITDGKTIVHGDSGK